MLVWMKLSQSGVCPLCMKACFRARHLYHLGVVVHTWNPSSWEMEAGGFKVQGHPQLQSEFKASLG